MLWLGDSFGLTWISLRNRRKPLKKPQTLWIGIVLVALLMLLGCTRQPILLDQTVPHRIAEPTTVYVWARGPDGKMMKAPAQVADGWWLASPLLVESPSK